ncbi:DUF6985 domain-containing protein [Actinoplanes sp. HUAS TT8]|uniref:DUF6985 domain-containing protein n=1 Tax=Actinoplanes sp. HUAS TT8 TaxID=3447453 RepID=UPI003F520692
MEIPGLGTVVLDDKLGWYLSAEIAVPVLDDAPCMFALAGYDDDPAPEDFHAAIQAFLALDRSAMEAAIPHIYAYARDVIDDVGEEWGLEIDGPADVLNHVGFVELITVSRDHWGDQRVYVSVEGDCDWEEEHGLQIVFRDGAAVTKIGPYDGHLTNANAYDDDSLADVIYREVPRR